MSKELKTFNYWCPNRGKCPTCTYCDKTGGLQIEAEVEVVNKQPSYPTEQYVCPSADEDISLKIMGMSVPKANFIKMSDAAVAADRKQRSKDHFKKEIFETLPLEDRKIFARKNADLAKRMK